MAKRGRPRKEGERYTNGRLKPAKEKIAPTLSRRMKDRLAQECGDAKQGYHLGILLCDEKISEAEHQAGCKFADIMMRGDLYMGRRRSAKSPSYQRGIGQESDTDVQIVDGYGASAQASRENPTPQEEQAMAAEEAVRNLRGALRDAGWSPNLYLLERLCIENEPLTSAGMTIARSMLQILVGYFGTESAPKKKTKAHRPVARVEKIRPRMMPQREVDYAMDMLSRLRPDLSRDHLSREWANFCALRDRDIFRNSRDHVIGAVR